MSENKAQSVSASEDNWKREGELRSFGRRKARRLNEAQQDAWNRLLPQYQLTLPSPDLTPSAKLDMSEYNAYREIWLEIGFGAGEHIVATAQANPEVLILGAEPFVNGVAQCLVDMEARHITNIRVLCDDAQLLLDALPDKCISRTDILFPDPWRKKAHHKRRLINAVTLNKLARIMCKGGMLHLATDHQDYAAWMLEQLALCPHFEWNARAQADFLQPPDDWVETRYQTKALKQGREAVFINAERIA